MIRYILNSRKNLFWLLFHAALGAVSIITPWVLIVWFYFVLLTSLFSLVRKTEGSFVPLVYLIVYSASFELLARMSGTSPFIPYELGKYIMLVLLLFGILKGHRKGYIGWLMLILLLPAALFDTSGERTVRNIVFNLIGPVNVALAVVFFSKQEIDKENFVNALKLLLYPLVAVLAFTILGSPSLEKIEFTLSANFEASGGFGTNQVSTALGLGAFLVFLFWRNKWALTGYRWADMLLLIAFAFRGLLTFSRGGMIGGALGILVLLFLDRGEQTERIALRPVRFVITVVPVLLLLIATFKYADKITGGLLSLRYKGETAGTLAGRKEKTLNVITSNRIQIFSNDLKLWKENPVLGVGVGASVNLREKSKGFLSHIEISRLLSEHGILGLIYTLILLKLGSDIFRRHRHIQYGSILASLYIIALFTTFHAAMRTYISPLLFGLSMLTIAYGGDDEPGYES